MTKISVKKQKISIERDQAIFRVSQDGNFCALFHNSSSEKAIISVIDLREEKDNLSTKVDIHNPKTKSYGQDRITEIFDISPDGRFISLAVTDWWNVADGHDGMICYIYDTKERQYLPNFVTQSMMYKSYNAFGIDGRRGFDIAECRFLDDFRLATVSVSGEVFIWNYQTRSLIFSWSAASHLAYCTAFSTKFGQFAMSEGHHDRARSGRIGTYRIIWSQIQTHENKWGTLRQGNFLRLWDIHSGRAVQEFDYSEPLSNLMFSLNDKLLAGYDQKVKRTIVWNIDANTYVRISGYPLGFFSDENYLIIREDNTIKLWDSSIKTWNDDFMYTSEFEIVDCVVSDTNKIFLLCTTSDNWHIHTVTIDF